MNKAEKDKFLKELSKVLFVEDQLVTSGGLCAPEPVQYDVMNHTGEVVVTFEGKTIRLSQP